MATLRELTLEEKKMVLDFFVSSDWILDFDDHSFDVFSAERIGVGLVSRYAMSSGEALRSYVAEVGHSSQTLMLFRALCEYYRKKNPCRADDATDRGITFRTIEEIVFDAIGSGVAIAPRRILLGNDETNHLKEESELALDAVVRGDFGSAITKAKTALEGALKYALRKSRGETKGFKDIPQLLAMVRCDYGIPAGKDTNKLFNQFYTGISTTVGAIAEIRNAVADSHGRSIPVAPVGETHARLYVNICISLCEYVMALVFERGGL